MNLRDLVPVSDKAVTVKNILKTNASATLIRLKSGGQLSDHQSKTDALLILLEGKVSYIEEGRNVELQHPHDLVEIPEKVTHKLVAEEASLLLLIQ